MTDTGDQVMSMPATSVERSDFPDSENFKTTHWSLVLAAGDRDAREWREAMSVLCTTYWLPLYAFVRRQGYSAEQAEDLTQEFFVRLMEKDFLRSVDRAKGLFRSYLLACLQHFLSNARDQQLAQKRGGGRKGVSLDFRTAEKSYRLEPRDNRTAERVFERQWALAILLHVLDRLQEEWTTTGREVHFKALKVFLTGEDHPATYNEIAQQLGSSVPAMKVAVHRMRRRFRELLREEIGRGVTEPAEIDEEIRRLFAAVRYIP
jgi:RNA polymerase sigma-70 factor (ECF subfamily)